MPTTTTTSIAQLQVPGTGAVSEEEPDPGLSTETKLALVVGGLVGVGMTIAVLTVLYWRHTRPVDVAPALDDLLVMAPVPAAPDDERRTRVGAGAGTAEAPAPVADPGEEATTVMPGSGAVATEVAPGAGVIPSERPEPIVTLEDLGLAGEPGPAGGAPSADDRT